MSDSLPLNLNIAAVTNSALTMPNRFALIFDCGEPLTSFFFSSHNIEKERSTTNEITFSIDHMDYVVSDIMSAWKESFLSNLDAELRVSCHLCFVFINIVVIGSYKQDDG